MAKFVTTLFTAVLILMGATSIFLPMVLVLGGAPPADLVWYLLSFLIGLSMIVLPSAFPIALLASSLATKDGILRGLSAVLSFGLGVMITLSFYGVLISLIGRAGLSFLHLHTEDVLYWMFFFSGIFVYILALTEIGVLRPSLRSHIGKIREYDDRKHPQLELFFLGILLGNIGVGGMHSGIPLLFLDAGVTGDIVHGWLLFFANALGRIFPLLLLVMLSVRGVPALKWLALRKDVIRYLSGWVMLGIAVFLTTLGFFGYDWLLGNLRYGSASLVPLSYVLLGNAFLLLLLLIPIWVSYLRERGQIFRGSNFEKEKIQDRIDDLHEERLGAGAVPDMSIGILKEHERHISHKIEGLEKEKHIMSNADHHGVAASLHNIRTRGKQNDVLRVKRNRGLALSGALVLALLLLPYEFGAREEVSAEVAGESVGTLYE